MPSRLSSPIVWAALLCAVLVYSAAVKPRKEQAFHCLAHISEIRVLRGMVAGNPARVSSGTSYLVRLRPKEAVDVYGRKYSCKGEITAFISKETVEAYHPGGLFTASRKGGAVLCESGAVLEVQGKFSRGTNGYQAASSIHDAHAPDNHGAMRGTGSPIPADKGSVREQGGSSLAAIDNGDVFSVKTARALGWGTSPLSYVRHFRALCRLRFRSLMAFWGSAGGLLLALISGIREYTEGDTREAFRYAGLSHVLALSGMHLSLVSGMTGSASGKMAGQRVAYFVQALSAALFVWFAGFTPSLLRAFIMAYMLLFMALLGVRQKDLFVVLCAVFLLHAVLAPKDMKTAAFMLSYGALAGILTVGEASKGVLSCAVPPVLGSPLCASIGAQMFTAPISLCLFGEFMPIGIIASVVVSPLVVVFIYLGIVLLALSLAIPPLAVPSGAVLGAMYKVIKWIVVFFSRAPGVYWVY